MIEFEKKFIESKGKPFVENGTKYHMVLSLKTGRHQGIRVRILKGIEHPRQGIRFDSESSLQANGVRGSSLVFWRKSAPSEFDVGCSPNSDIDIRNVWDHGDGVEQSWHAGGAMIVEEEGDVIRIRANSTLLNDKCEDLIVELSWLDVLPQKDSKKPSWLARLFNR